VPSWGLRDDEHSAGSCLSVNTWEGGSELCPCPCFTACPPPLPSIPLAAPGACWGKGTWLGEHPQCPCAEQGSAWLPRDGSYQPGSLLSAQHQPTHPFPGSRARQPRQYPPLPPAALPSTPDLGTRGSAKPPNTEAPRWRDCSKVVCAGRDGEGRWRWWEGGDESFRGSQISIFPLLEN